MATTIPSRRMRPLMVSVAVCFVTSLICCQSLQISRLYQNGAVATAAPPATDVGLQILESGGNAFDAAVAIGFALAVVHPEAGNIGGGGFAVIRDGSSRKVRTLDFRERAPLAASVDMYLDIEGAVVDGKSTVGASAAGVPGTVAGLHELWKEHGSLEWKTLLEPAIALADSGFVIDKGLAESMLHYEDKLRSFPETEAVYMPLGRPMQVDERLTQSDLALTLRMIALDGPVGFYEGVTAERIISTMNRHGGLISAEDLEQYRPVWRQPIEFSFDSLTIYSMPPPSSGGICLAQILRLLEPYDFSTYTPDSPEYIHLFSEAARLAFSDRSKHLGDPEFYDIPPGLLDPAYLDRRRSSISLREASSSEHVLAGNPLAIESDQTTHFSVCDGKGNMVALTYTLNAAYGCELVVEGAGFLLNNEMDDFSIKPGVPNLYGLVGGEANKIEPGKRMLSSMSPTLVMVGNRPLMALGAPGGSKIITVVAQAILNYTRFSLTPQETVTQPRFHHQWLPDQIYLEIGKFDISVTQTLIGYGHFIKERSEYSDLQMIVFDPLGTMEASSDPRKRGKASGH